MSATLCGRVFTATEHTGGWLVSEAGNDVVKWLLVRRPGRDAHLVIRTEWRPLCEPPVCTVVDETAFAGDADHCAAFVGDYALLHDPSDLH